MKMTIAVGSRAAASCWPLCRSTGAGSVASAETWRPLVSRCMRLALGVGSPPPTAGSIHQGTPEVHPQWLWCWKKLLYVAAESYCYREGKGGGLFQERKGLYFILLLGCEMQLWGRGSWADFYVCTASGVRLWAWLWKEAGHSLEQGCEQRPMEGVVGSAS